MILSAIYIPENSLPHIFGEGHTGQTLNLGGEYIYSFTETFKEINLESKIKNELFIPNFYNKDISLISTIVGQNGAGKSTLLRGINHSIDPSSKKLVYVFEPESTTAIQIFNDTTKRFLCSNHLEHNFLDTKPFESLYYSPSLDFDLTDAWSPIALINYLKNGLENYFLDSVSRNVSFLNDQIIESIKAVYHDFPSYDSITVKAKTYRKSFFRVPYIESNFGSHRVDALKNEMKGELNRFKDENYGNKIYTRAEVIKRLEMDVRFLESESFTEMFTKLWKIEEYNFADDSGYDFVHSADSFIKNLEINILSFLLLGATFPQTGLGGRPSFDKIIEADSFKDRLDLFLELYLGNEHNDLTETIKKEVNIDVANFELIIEIIKKDYRTEFHSVDVKPIKQRMISDVQGFGDIYTFYVKLNEFCKNDSIQFHEDALIFNIKNNETKLLFDELIFSYKYVLKSFPKSPVTISLLDFIPNKKLSTGEKAILDFYSSIYSYIEINKESLHLNYEYFLLLLDEPDLGFHPLWKKKFIKAITTTLPILFSKMTPHKYDGEDYVKVGENPIIQILFTTHDPLTLSDIPNNAVVYIKKDEQYSSILPNDHIDRPQKTFGANITNLLADSFFIENGLIGEFAKTKIEETINWINQNKPHKTIDEVELEYYKSVIELIDEKIVRLKLSEMLSEIEGNNDFQKAVYDKEIDFLIKQRDKLN